MQQPLDLLTKNATIFWEHEVFVDCCHSNLAIYIFFVFSFVYFYIFKSVKIMEKITVVILVLSTIFCFVIPHVIMPNVGMNLSKKYDPITSN